MKVRINPPYNNN